MEPLGQSFSGRGIAEAFELRLLVDIRGDFCERSRHVGAGDRVSFEQGLRGAKSLVGSCVERCNRRRRIAIESLGVIRLRVKRHRLVGVDSPYAVDDSRRKSCKIEKNLQLKCERTGAWDFYREF